MAVLSELDRIKKIIELGEPSWITEAKAETMKLQVHVNGVGTAEYLNNIINFENKTQFELRRKYATSNKFVYANLLRPVDKIFSAKGGSKIINGSESTKKKVREYVSKIDGNQSITKWIENIQANKYYSDPTGLVFFEWKDGKTWPTIKSINVITNYKQVGRSVEWVVFAPEKRYNSLGVLIDADYVRFVDKDKDYMLKVTRKTIKNNALIEFFKKDESTPVKIETTIEIVKDETFDNPFGEVPAIINSNIIGSNLKYNISPIDNTVGLGDHYLRTTSVKNIYEFLHGYPRYWEYTRKCKICDGTGIYNNEPCETCKGTGRELRKDVSDVLALTIPKEGQPKLAPDVAGYVQPDLETWREQRTELDWIWGLMHFTTWGTATQDKADNETATGKFIDSQPVNDRLNNFADAFEDMEQRMTNLAGTFYLQNGYKGSMINYGRRFLIEPPDVIWKKYETARSSGAPKVTLDYLLIQFYQAEFANDIESLAIALKGIKLEPFVHLSDNQVQTITLIREEDKIRKHYFNEWFKSLTENEILETDIIKLKELFDTFIKELLIIPLKEEDKDERTQEV